MMRNIKILCYLFGGLTMTQNALAQSVESWQTAANESKLFQKQTDKEFVDGTGSNSIKITINDAVHYQTIEGFGWTMTEGSAYWIMQLPQEDRTALLEELFSLENGMGSAYIRIAIGASDLGQGSYTYQDNQSQPFSLAGPDLIYLVPVLKEIVQINPNIKFLGSPWSAPAWMKTNNSLRGGSLKKEHFGAYSDYFLKYFQAMKDQGIDIYAVTIQNEPMYDGNNPSMYMSKEDQYDFVQNYLGPKVRSSTFSQVKLIGYDHNCDNTDYPIYVARSEYMEGTAFHLYGGDISAMSNVYNQTQKSVYFTEQSTAANKTFTNEFNRHMRDVMLRGVNNMGKAVVEWNLASNESWEPFTSNGGCTLCLGAITINSNDHAITRNQPYYTVAQMSKVTRFGSVRIASVSADGNLFHSAFTNPNGSTSLVVYNISSSEKTFDIQWNGKVCSYTLTGSTAVSLIWSPISVTTPVIGVSVSPSSVEIPVRQTVQLTATVLPENATLKTVKWSSNNETIATVDANGLVKAHRAGHATITATTKNENKAAVCPITVTTNLGLGMFPHVYNIVSVYTDKHLDLRDANQGTSLQQWTMSDKGGNNQRWFFEYAGEDVYFIRSKFSNLYLQAMATGNNGKIQQYDIFTGNENQQWKIEQQADIFSIKSVFAGTVMSVASINNGAEVNLTNDLGNFDQKWRIIEVETVPSAIHPVAANGSFALYPNPASDFITVRYDVPGERTYNIYALSGVLIDAGKLSQLSNEIDLNRFKQGIYILKVQEGDTASYAKIVKK